MIWIDFSILEPSWVNLLGWNGHWSLTLPTLDHRLPVVDYLWVKTQPIRGMTFEREISFLENTTLWITLVALVHCQRVKWSVLTLSMILSPSNTRTSIFSIYLSVFRICIDKAVLYERKKSNPELRFGLEISPEILATDGEEFDARLDSWCKDDCISGLPGLVAQSATRTISFNILM